MALSKIDPAGLDIGQIGGRRNLIINGAQVIDQRNGGASVATSSGSSAFVTDRWAIYYDATSKVSAEQNQGSVTPPVGFSNYLGATSLSAYTIGASERIAFQQTIEGFNGSALAWGTSDAKTATLSFWVRSSLTGTFGGSLRNGTSGTPSYPFTYSISAANTWEYKTVTITGPTTGSWDSTNGAFVQVWLSLGAGASVSGTAGAWAGSTLFSATGATSVVGTNGATFYFTGVQLEVGSVATPFEHRSYGEELALCQRYYQECRGLSPVTGYHNGTTQIIFNIPLLAVLRAQPTVSYVNKSTRAAHTAIGKVSSSDLTTTYSSATISSYDYSDYTDGASVLQLRMNFTASVGGSDNTTCFIWPANTMQINSEL